MAFGARVIKYWVLGPSGVDADDWKPKAAAPYTAYGDSLYGHRCASSVIKWDSSTYQHQILVPLLAALHPSMVWNIWSIGYGIWYSSGLLYRGLGSICKKPCDRQPRPNRGACKISAATCKSATRRSRASTADKS